MSGKLRAAFGKVEITPKENVLLRGYPLRNNFIVNVEKGILDDIFARISVLDDSYTRVLIISIDCCVVAEDELNGNGTPELTFPNGTTDRWADAAGTTFQCTSVYATHTHGAPSRFTEQDISVITEEIRRISNQLSPVRVRIGQGQCSIAVNRRPSLKPNFKLPIDRSMEVLVFEDQQGELMGSIVKAAVHPTVLWNNADRITSDVVGIAIKRWESIQGSPFVSLFIQGFSGDVGPLSGGPKGGEMGDTYFLVKSLGKALYYDIMECITSLEEVQNTHLSVAKETIVLPTKMETSTTEKEVTLMGISLGGIGILSASLEVFNGYLKEIINHSPYKHTILSGLANGYGGYLPTKSAFEDGLGGYEMNVTPFTKEAADLFIEASIRMLNQLYHDKS